VQETEIVPSPRSKIIFKYIVKARDFVHPGQHYRYLKFHELQELKRYSLISGTRTELRN